MSVDLPLPERSHENIEFSFPYLEVNIPHTDDTNRSRSGFHPLILARRALFLEDSPGILSIDLPEIPDCDLDFPMVAIFGVEIRVSALP